MSEHLCIITSGGNVTVEYMRPDGRLGFTWGEDSSWFVVLLDGYSASGYLDERLDIDALRSALDKFRNNAH